MNTSYTTNKSMLEELKNIFTETNLDTLSEEMREYILKELGEQVIERVIVKMVQDLPEAKVSAFLEFIEKGASQESLYIYLTSIYPEAGEIISQTMREIVEEFRDGMK